MAEWHVLLLIDDVDQYRVPLVEGAAAAVLPAEANGHALRRQRAEGQRLGHTEIQRTLAISHLVPLLQQLLHLGMDVEVFGIFHQAIGDFTNALGGESGIDFVFRLPLAAMERRPVGRQLSHHRLLRHALAGDLRGIELRDELLYERLRILTGVPRVDLVEQSGGL